MGIIGFRPWNPLTWPSMKRLNFLCLLFLILCKLATPRYTQFFLKATITTLTIIVMKLIALYFYRSQRLNLFDQCNIPSVPNKNPISGNLFEVIVPGENLQIIHKYHQTLGKSFGMFYGPDPWVFTTDLELLHKLFVAEASNYIDMVQFRLPFIAEMNESLAQIQGEKWRWMRRILNPSFTLKQMKSDNVYQDISQACDKMMECIGGHPADQDGGNCRVVDMSYNMKKFSVEVIFRVAYGLMDGVNMKPEEKDPLIETILFGSKLIRGPIVWMSIMFDGLDRLLGLFSAFTPIGSVIRTIHSTLAKSLNERRKMKASQISADRKMIDSIIDNVDSSKMDDATLKANMFFIFLAGFETSANTGAILLWLLALHPEVQEKLRTSILEYGNEKSKYLEWCIHETLRLYPAVPTAVGRLVHEDFQFKGQTYKRGVSINASVHSIHHSEEHWGHDVEDFRPERFGEPFKHPLQFFAFGYGPRVCIGANLAMMELREMISRILFKYRLETTPTTPKKLDFTSPNLIHMIIEDPIDLKLIELSSI